MRISKMILMFVAITMVFSMAAFADDHGTMKKEAQTTVKAKESKSLEKVTVAAVAEVFVPELKEDKAKKAVIILKEFKEIIGVKMDKEASTLMVTYPTDFNFKEKVMPKLMELDKDIELKGIEKTKLTEKDKCAGCPHKAKCASETEKKEAPKKEGEKTVETKTGCSGHSHE